MFRTIGKNKFPKTKALFVMVPLFLITFSMAMALNTPTGKKSSAVNSPQYFDLSEDKAEYIPSFPEY